MVPRLKKWVIEKYVDQWVSDLNHRFRSWDHCYKVFQLEKQIELKTLNLAFYLASWGMYRGSGGLLQKNHLVHEGAVEILESNEFLAIKSTVDKDISIDSIPKILELKQALYNYYIEIKYMRKNVFRDISPTGTLISKILLGTYACVPAFDRYFVLGLKEAGMTQSDFTLESLKELFEFIDRNIKELVESQKYINSYVKKDNYPGYPIMKIVDMYFWQIGFDVGS